jgi:nitrous oxide reductase accessory protein NosL
MSLLTRFLRRYECYGCSVKAIRNFGNQCAVGGVLFSMVLLGAGCENAPVKPVSIGPNDVCFYCKSPITDLAFAAEFITKDGFVRKFDDIGCLVANVRKVGRKNIQAFYVMDALSKTWLSAQEAQFIRSDKIRTPKNGGIIAFRDASKAQQMASRYQAEIIPFEDIVK